jgi:hypothetical protein
MAWFPVAAPPKKKGFDGPADYFDIFDKNHGGFLFRKEPHGPLPEKNAIFKCNLINCLIIFVVCCGPRISRHNNTL